ncbi:MAG: DUF2177 family protein [Syntrophaceae bacterium]|nr:DUF2177 family protein [Syntrophaceae bacterium]
MSVKNTILLYVITFVCFFLIDMVWLGVVAKGFYRRHLGEMLSSRVNWIAAILFYLLFIFGLVVFVVRPMTIQNAPLNALALGALLGLLCYATYDLTNLATLKDWPLVVTVVDLIWGTVLGASVSLVSVLLGRMLIKT